MKLIIVGDSLPMPRPKEGISYEHTYPSILQERLCGVVQVINRSRRMNTSRKAALPNNLSDDIMDFTPDIFIYHIGIVDCAPRLFSELQQKILGRMPSFIAERIIRFFSARRFFFTKNFPKVYVKKNDFYKSVKHTIEFARQFTNRVLIVGISHSNKTVLAKSYSFTENVNEYNDELVRVSQELEVDYLDTRKLLDPENDLLPDGIHYKLSANKKVAAAILEKIKLSSISCVK